MRFASPLLLITSALDSASLRADSAIAPCRFSIAPCRSAIVPCGFSIASSGFAIASSGFAIASSGFAIAPSKSLSPARILYLSEPPYRPVRIRPPCQYVGRLLRRNNRCNELNKILHDSL